MLHEGDASREDALTSLRARRYFRLFHPLTGKLPRCTDSEVQLVRMPEDAEAVARFICECYPDMRPTPEAVLGWTRADFHPELWLWVTSPQGEKMALGIAAWDERMREASLEWIQTHPRFQGRGAGKKVVGALLARARGMAAFATVSGESPAAEALYRSCGFSGDDVYRVISR